MKLSCRCSCIQPYFKFAARSSKTHKYVHTEFTKVHLLHSKLFKGQNRSEYPSAGRQLQCLQVGKMLVLCICQKVKYSQYIFIFNSRKHIYCTQNYLKGKIDLGILLQEGSCSACRLVKCQFCGSVVN